MSPYDGGVRTPVLIRWPGKFEPGRDADLVSTQDAEDEVAKLLLGDIDPTTGTEVFESGKNGKPFYVNGPPESMQRDREHRAIRTRGSGATDWGLG